MRVGGFGHHKEVKMGDVILVQEGGNIGVQERQSTGGESYRLVAV